MKFSHTRHCFPVQGLGQWCTDMVGLSGQVISNDRYKSVLHRAVVNCGKERISIPTFYCPSPDAVVGPAPELVTHDQPAVYRNFTYEEYYTQFWNSGLTTECCLDRFKASPVQDA